MTATFALILAVAPAAAGGLFGPDTLQMIGFPIVLVGLFYFMILRPQQTRAKQHRMQIEAIKRGDQVVLSSGVKGKVVRVEDKEVGVEIAPNVTVKVVKAMITDVATRGEPAAANDSKS
jgi:preprotein translocase subunit YajC